jgi:hypothetical protein
MQDYERQFRWDQHSETVLKRIDGNELILPQNKALIRNFVTYLTARGAKPGTVWRHVYSYEKLLDAFDYKVEILQASKEDIVKAIAKIERLWCGPLHSRNAPRYNARGGERVGDGLPVQVEARGQDPHRHGIYHHVDLDI